MRFTPRIAGMIALLALLPVVLFGLGPGDQDAFASERNESSQSVGRLSPRSGPPRPSGYGWSLVYIRLTTSSLRSVLSPHLSPRCRSGPQRRPALGRRAPRLSALTISKEAGEVMPALVFVLLALYLLVRYVRPTTERCSGGERGRWCRHRIRTDGRAGYPSHRRRLRPACPCR